MAIKIEIQELEIENTQINRLKINISYNVLGVLDIFKIRIDKDKIQKIINKSSKKTDVKQLKFKDIKEILQKVIIDKVYIKAKLGTKNPIGTSVLITAIATILAVILARKVDYPRYKIEPIYEDKNYLFLSINCIFRIKLVHIINIIKKVRRKEVCQQYGKTSHRRTYANNNG